MRKEGGRGGRREKNEFMTESIFWNEWDRKNGKSRREKKFVNEDRFSDAVIFKKHRVLHLSMKTVSLMQ